MATTDILIIGSGIAGLSLTHKLGICFPGLQITLLSKKSLLDSNTNLAQGGIAVMLDEKHDSFDQHIEDTLLAGDGLCKRDVVEQVIRRGPQELRDLLSVGIEFDRDAYGKVCLAREGGHRVSRVVHHFDRTGNHVAVGLLRVLSQHKNVVVKEHHFVLDLLTDNHGGLTQCVGALVADPVKNRVTKLFSKVTILATGGTGQVYKSTTNPTVATGDGIAMAHRAGAKISGMEFIQFHPTAFCSQNANPNFLISEAVRGFGAYLVNDKGERFVKRYDRRGELASRDIVAKAIFSEMESSGSSSVSLDCRHLDQEQLRQHFPNIYKHCVEHGYNPATALIPVEPAAHYLCGGIEVDINGSSSIENLFACGECANTGLHGANRLASNSLLEALAYSSFIVEHLKKVMKDLRGISAEEKNEVTIPKCDATWVSSARHQLAEVMTKHAGIIRNFSGLRYASGIVAELRIKISNEYVRCPSIDIAELRNLADVSSLILEQALQRKENRGTHFNNDIQ